MTNQTTIPLMNKVQADKPINETFISASYRIMVYL